VRSRERYEWGLLQMDYDRVVNMSDDMVARDYRRSTPAPMRSTDSSDPGPDDASGSCRRRCHRMSPDVRSFISSARPAETASRTLNPPQRFVVTLAYIYRRRFHARERGD